MAQITVGEAMGELPRPLAPEQPLRDVLDRFASERTDALPVIDADGALLGIVTAIDVEQAIGNSRDGQTASSLVHETPELRVDQSLEDAVRRARPSPTTRAYPSSTQTARSASDGSPTGACCAPTTHAWRTDQEPTRQPASIPPESEI